MSKSKFLGPWREKEDLILNSKGNLVAKIVHDGRSLEEFEANKRLIAAAPEMLEALEDCLNYFNYAEELDAYEFAEEVRELIHKAKGGG